MATVAVAVERRALPRMPGGGTRWTTRAVLRPGQPVILINISSGAALVESSARLRPGAQTELQLWNAGGRVAMKARLERCYVSSLEPLLYRGVVVFDRSIDIAGDAP